MRILIAPDKFKGALNAREVAESIAAGLREVLPDAGIDVAPMADGGEGTAEAICDALGGSWLKCKAHDPLGREIEAHYAWIGLGGSATNDGGFGMARALGFRFEQEHERRRVNDLITLTRIEKPKDLKLP